MRRDLVSMLLQQRRPDLNVTVLDLGQSQIQRLLLRVRLRPGKDAVQVRGIGLVLPMMLEGVKVR